MDRYPVILQATDQHRVAIYQGQEIKLDLFKTHVLQLLCALPDHQYSINYCENRYHFLVVFVAAMLKGQVTLLPGSRVESEISRLKNTYSDYYEINDQKLATICRSRILDEQGDIDWTLSEEQVVTILFTSGTQGTPKANQKTWGQLWKSATAVKNRFNLNSREQQLLIATIPSQHMFGLEMTILAPLVHGNCVYDGMPFYPADVQQVLIDHQDDSCILITTPLQLKSLVATELNWPKIEFVISATAPLSKALAQEAELQIGTRIYEIYGCSEAGAIATRHLTDEESWLLLEGYELKPAKNSSLLTAPGYTSEVEIPDIIARLPGKRFTLVGRDADVVKIAGKRASLRQLTDAMKSLSGIEDAIVFMPDATIDRVTRTAALVVAPDKTIDKLRRELYRVIDPAFIPRPLVKVTKLPYNAVGKLPRDELERAIRAVNKRAVKKGKVNG